VYLNDHLASATLGLELVRRTARENRDSTLGSFLADVLLPEIEGVAACRVGRPRGRYRGQAGALAALEAAGNGGLDGFDFQALAERAEFQRSRLEKYRLAAVTAALGEPSASAVATVRSNPS